MFYNPNERIQTPSYNLNEHMQVCDNVRVLVYDNEVPL